MRIYIAQINPTVGDLPSNTDKIILNLDLARQAMADLVLFPECCLSGYPAQDFWLMPHFLDEVESYLQEIIKSTKGLAAVVGLPRRHGDSVEKPLFNSAAVIEDGRLLGYVDKVLLPEYDVFDERRYFSSGRTPRVFEIAGEMVAITICEDIWGHGNGVEDSNYQRDPVLELLPLKPTLCLNLSASPYHYQKFESRLKVCQKTAETLNCPLILCNQVGGNDSLIFDGASLVVSPIGNVLELLDGFKECYKVFDTAHYYEPKKIEVDPEERLFKALVLGVRDYFHKSGFQKACLGLSGGIDSALVACIAKEALGEKNVLGVIMPSRYSTPGSIKDAEALAYNLQIPFKQIGIEEVFASCLQTLAPSFKGLKENVAEENIQARVRGLLLMALSNKFGYLLLSTGNKSEMAMGYCTLYGDMCGGLSVISDLTKGQVYALARWLNRKEVLIPESTLTKPPSAELRHNQKDSDSLPDYEIVDKILNAYVEEHKSPKQIAEEYDLALSLVEEMVLKMHQNEYKRRQAAPGLRVTPKAFSTGRKFPLVQRFVT